MEFWRKTGPSELGRDVSHFIPLGNYLLWVWTGELAHLRYVYIREIFMDCIGWCERLNPEGSQMQKQVSSYANSPTQGLWLSKRQLRVKLQSGA